MLNQGSECTHGSLVSQFAPGRGRGGRRTGPRGRMELNNGEESSKRRDVCRDCGRVIAELIPANVFFFICHVEFIHHVFFIHLFFFQVGFLGLYLIVIDVTFI